MLALLGIVAIAQPCYFVAGAYYAARKIVIGLLKDNNHLVTRVKSNAVAYTPYQQRGPRKRGRPKVYDRKVKLKSLLQDSRGREQAKSPVYGERQVVMQYKVCDLLWRPAGRLVRFPPCRSWSWPTPCATVCRNFSRIPPQATASRISSSNGRTAIICRRSGSRPEPGLGQNSGLARRGNLPANCYKSMLLCETPVSAEAPSASDAPGSHARRPSTRNVWSYPAVLHRAPHKRLAAGFPSQAWAATPY